MTAGEIAKGLLNMLYPLRCASCGKALEAAAGTGVCAACESGIRQNTGPSCPKCGRALSAGAPYCAECKNTDFVFSVARSACLYDGVLKGLVHLFKYKGKIALSRLFAGKMLGFLSENGYVADGVDLVTFVPMHPSRRRGRDYNQSEVLAGIVAKALRLPPIAALDKVRPTKRQNELSRAERLANLAGAFRSRRGLALDGARILLIDDVMTTGATLNECARALKAAGAAEVRCLTLARGI